MRIWKWYKELLLTSALGSRCSGSMTAKLISLDDDLQDWQPRQQGIHLRTERIMPQSIRGLPVMASALPIWAHRRVKSVQIHRTIQRFQFAERPTLSDISLENTMNCRFFHVLTQAGFTLVELSIAIAIIGIMATIAVPNILGEMPKFRLNGATSQIAGHLMEARMMAVKQNKDIKVTFTNGNEYKICEEPCLEPNPKKINIQDNFNGVTTGTLNHPTFSPRGTSTIETINVSNSYGAKTITVAITGRVKIN